MTIKWYYLLLEKRSLACENSPYRYAPASRHCCDARLMVTNANDCGIRDQEYILIRFT